MIQHPMQISLKVVGSILFWIFILGIALLFVWFLAFYFCGDMAFNIHKHFFNITKDQFNSFNWCLMGIAKAFLLFFVLCPYIAIRIVLKKILKEQ